MAPFERHLFICTNQRPADHPRGCCDPEAGAALARLESTIALEKLLDFMPEFEGDYDNCKRVQMQNVVGWKHVPVRILR